MYQSVEFPLVLWKELEKKIPILDDILEKWVGCVLVLRATLDLLLFSISPFPLTKVESLLFLLQYILQIIWQFCTNFLHSRQVYVYICPKNRYEKKILQLHMYVMKFLDYLELKTIIFMHLHFQGFFWNISWKRRRSG